MADPLATRLRQLADDCEERARRSISGEARSLYWQAAREARQSAAVVALASERRETLAAMTGLAVIARWYDGEPLKTTEPVRPLVRQAVEEQQKPAGIGTKPADLRSDKTCEGLPTGQLARMFGLTDRTVRRAIVEAVRRQLPGFYRDGWTWRADPEAFAARMSELCPRAGRAVRSANDSADHSQAA